MCGPTSAQQTLSDEQNEFYSTLTNGYNEEYKDFQSGLSALTSSLKPILDAGINQEGFNAQEKSALNTQATEGTASTYSKAATALGNQIAGEGGGDTPGVTNGADKQTQEQLASSAAANEAAEKNQIVQSDYATGRQNYLTAEQALAQTTGMENPEGLANAANSGGQAAEQTDNQIAQEQDAWLQPVMGALGGVTSSLIDENPGNIFGK